MVLWDRIKIYRTHITHIHTRTQHTQSHCHRCYRIICNKHKPSAIIQRQREKRQQKKNHPWKYFKHRLFYSIAPVVVYTKLYGLMIASTHHHHFPHQSAWAVHLCAQFRAHDERIGLSVACVCVCARPYACMCARYIGIILVVCTVLKSNERCCIMKMANKNTNQHRLWRCCFNLSLGWIARERSNVFQPDKYIFIALEMFHSTSLLPLSLFFLFFFFVPLQTRTKSRRKKITKHWKLQINTSDSFLVLFPLFRR